ncbi:diguanylate cyclase [uncultured Amphritea sp.]|uniref:diguanylate cyclase n=1 Tax=uncultured Amphritea sp. TaxID=981605 RepID=UPI002610870E|nr:diguanylate cyclase [uncultured Amphritea sp.]
MLAATRSLYLNKTKLLVTIAAVVGVLISIIAYQFSASLEHQQLHSEVARLGAEQRAKFQSGVSRTVEILDAVGSFISQSDNLSRQSFGLFVQPIVQHHPELWAVNWIPRIGKEQRDWFETKLAQQGFPGGITALNQQDSSVFPSPQHDVYYPVFYSEPLDKNRWVIGLNAYSRDINAPVIDALLTGNEQYLSTAPLHLVNEDNGSLALIYFRPVYEHQPSGIVVLKGFVTALIQPQILLNELSPANSEMVMRLYDVTKGGSVEIAATAKPDQVISTASYSSEFLALGRSWRLQAWNAVLQVEAKQGKAQWVLLSGLLLTLLIVTVLFWLARSHRQILLERDLAQNYLDTVETIMLMLNRQGDIQMINRKGSEVLGFNIGNLLGVNWFSSHFLADSQGERRSFEALFDNDLPANDLYKSESEIRSRDGQLRLISWSNKLRLDGNNRIVGVLCAGVDITEQRRIEVLDQLRSRAMKAALQGASLSYVLNLVLKGIEQQNPGALCSILLLDDSGQRLLSCAGPSLPKEFDEAVHGVQIGEGVGSCGTSAYRRERVIVEDIETHPFWTEFSDLALGYNLRSCWSEPIFGKKNRLLGTFAVYHQFMSQPTSADLELTESMAEFVSILIEEFQVEAALTRMATTDDLTGLNNRRKLFEILAAEFKRSRRYERPLSLCMVDLDYFKKVNDQYGHDAGDRVLQAVAKTIVEVLRESDFAGRIGGEEFALLLPDTCLQSAARVAERLRRQVEQIVVTLETGEYVILTCSIGVAEYHRGLEQASELLSCADQHLYYAKAHGRNCISTGSEQLSVAPDEAGSS